MAQTLVIGLEKQRINQLLPKSPPPKLSLPMSCLGGGGLIKSVEGELAAPSCLLTKVGSPIMGAPLLEGSPNLGEPKKVHLDLLSALQAIRVPPTRARPQHPRRCRRAPLCGPELCLLPLSIYLPSRVSPTPGGSLAHGRLPRWGARVTVRDRGRGRAAPGGSEG